MNPLISNRWIFFIKESLESRLTELLSNINNPPDLRGRIERIQHRRHRSCQMVDIFVSIPKQLSLCIAQPRRGFYIPKIDKSTSLVFPGEVIQKKSFEKKEEKAEIFNKGFISETKKDEKHNRQQSNKIKAKGQRKNNRESQIKVKSQKEPRKGVVKLRTPIGGRQMLQVKINRSQKKPIQIQGLTNKDDYKMKDKRKSQSQEDRPHEEEIKWIFERKKKKQGDCIELQEIQSFLFEEKKDVRKRIQVKKEGVLEKEKQKKKEGSKRKSKRKRKRNESSERELQSKKKTPGRKFD